MKNTWKENFLMESAPAKPDNLFTSADMNIKIQRVDSIGMRIGKILVNGKKEVLPKRLEKAAAKALATVGCKDVSDERGISLIIDIEVEFDKKGSIKVFFRFDNEGAGKAKVKTQSDCFTVSRTISESEGLSRAVESAVIEGAFQVLFSFSECFSISGMDHKIGGTHDKAL